MKTIVLTPYKLTAQFFEEAYRQFANVAQYAKTVENDPGELADTAVAIRECERMLHSLLKQVREIQNQAEAKAALALTMKGEIEIKTEFTSAKVSMKQTPRVPKQSQDPEAFAKLMDWLGVPEEVYEDRNGQGGAVHIHWPGFVEEFTRRRVNGEQLPDGVDPQSVRTIHRLSPLRKRKELIDPAT